MRREWIVRDYKTGKTLLRAAWLKISVHNNLICLVVVVVMQLLIYPCWLYEVCM